MSQPKPKYARGNKEFKVLIMDSICGYRRKEPADFQKEYKKYR